MAESFSVRAILSAIDKGFSSTLKDVLGTTKSFKDEIKSGFAFGILAGAGQQAFSVITNTASDLIGETNQASKAWQTFEGNMKNFGKSAGDIAKVKGELQSFAETTVYCSSDMASTYAQLEAVGVGTMKSLSKGTSGLVKGFGGLAAAAEDPQQAMKSLSQQATQMAAKPKVAWEDFKIMLEQSPAGMAAVAKAMGMSTSELISKIQAGEVKTEAFFAAVEEAGTDAKYGFAQMAEKAKTVDQAFDGLKETLGNKLLPAFQVVSEWGIKALNGIADKLGEIDGEALADKVSAGIEKAKPYWESFKDVLADIGGVLKTVGGFLAEHSDTIAKCVPIVIKLAIAYKGFRIVNSLIPGMSKFAGAITSLAGKGISGIAAKLFGISKGEKAVGTASQTSATQTLAAAKSFMMMGAAVLMVSAGFALLAFSAVSLANAGGLAIAVMFGLIGAVALLGAGMMVMLKTLAPMSAQLMPVATAMLAMGAAVLIVSAGFAILAATSIMLANSGGLAIGIMVGMVAAIALLAVGAAALGPALTLGAQGFIAFGAAIALVGAGVLLASAGMALLATQLPTIAEYGLQSALAITALGGAMIVFAAGALLAGAGAVVLGAGLLAVSVGMAAVALAVTVLSAGILMIAAGALIAATSFALMAAVLPTIATHGTEGALALVALAGGLTVFSAGALLAGAAAVVLGAGLLTMGAGLLVVSSGVLVLCTGALMLATSMLLASTAITLFAFALPIVAQYGLQSALAITALGASMIAFAAGAIAAGAAAMVLGAGLAAVGVGIAAIGVSFAVVAVGLAAVGVGLAAVGLGIVALSASIIVATGALALLNLALPKTIQYGAQGTAAMVALGAGMLALGAGAAVAGASSLVLAAGLLVATAALIAFGAGMVTGSAGSLLMAAGLKAVNSSMKSIAKNAKTTQKSLKSMQSSVKTVSSGLDALGNKAKSSMKKITSAFDNTASKAKTAGQKVGKGFSSGMQNGLKTGVTVAKTSTAQIIVMLQAAAVAAKLSGTLLGNGFSAGVKGGMSAARSAAASSVSQVNATLRTGYSGAYSAGSYISLGFAQGMRSQLSSIKTAANQMVAAADKAIRAKAKIHSPAKLTDKLGTFFGLGWVNSIKAMAHEAWKAAEELVAIPNVAMPELAFAGAYDGELSADYEYYRNAQYNIEVVSTLDGREIARSSATYMQDELDRRQTRNDRKHGRV